MLLILKIANPPPPPTHHTKKVTLFYKWRSQESVTGVQRSFGIRIHTEPRILASIYAQNKAFQHKRCIFKANSPGPSSMSGENVDRVWACLKSSPQKSTPRRCFVWKHVWNVHRRAVMSPSLSYALQTKSCYAVTNFKITGIHDSCV